jgi:hypothetical protein
MRKSLVQIRKRDKTKMQKVKHSGMDSERVMFCVLRHPMDPETPSIQSGESK